MSLSLKYRPRQFQDLVGQDFIKQTLKKALAEDKMVSSYLLCGPRGTGKTTSARLIAKGFNCEHPNDGDPCNTCDMCVATNNESLIDVIEIDAASHTGVDNVREIIERAQFQPTQAKYKVYIIDEVHMLSKGAFNALLKILEEPPEHVKFILATTETHKVPETIISRCQRYDFKSIAKEELIARLKYISDKEGIRADSESLEYIANASAGGLRDAISLYEQLISDGEISYSELVKNLGLTDTETIHEIYQKLLTADLSAINDLHNIASEGKNLHKFYVSLLQYSKEQVFDSLGTQDVGDKIRIMNELNEALTRMKYSYDPEVTFVVMLSKILGVYQELETKVVEKEYEQKTTLAPQSIQIPKTPISETQVEQAEEISSEDFDDIFGDHEDPVKTVPVKKEVAQSSTGNFDSDTYIQTLRGLKVKGAIVIGLKQARSFNMTDEYLEIVLQNNFTLKALNTADNVLELIKGLEAMGIQEKTVKLS